ncbi:MAG: hypothetical protein COV75_05280 [Candidatus Omnitrophica bacterium CG11_big_fil_rev_8_21_14_0_20_63_9]|nr:MAG: hypothetical protein COV75_05280 [Candidatus Omnitrophica bacterium CG11_big_fil_rev_8_21_14_0_20_63_9]
MNRALPRLLCVLLVLLGAAPSASADLILFRNGTALRGKVIKRSATDVVIQFDFGTANFRPDEIAEIQPEEPEDEEPAAAQPTELPLPSPAAADAVVAAPPPPPVEAASPVEQAPQSLEDAVKAVAFIAVLTKTGGVGLGSGAAINEKGVLVTNYHVIHDAERIVVLLPGEQKVVAGKEPKTYDARLLRSDPCMDLALVQIPRKTPHYLRMAEHDELSIGAEVRAVGNPQGLAISVSKGVVSAVRTTRDFLMGGDVAELKVPACDAVSGRELNKATWIQTDAAINPGNSGGPLLDGSNRIVGINSMILSTSGGHQGLGFAVHVKHLRKFASGYLKKPPTD